MSWQEYIDTSLLGSGHITEAAIIGHDGSLWAHSSSYELSAEETLIILRAYEQPESLFQAGLTLRGTKVHALMTAQLEWIVYPAAG